MIILVCRYLIVLVFSITWDMILPFGQNREKTDWFPTSKDVREGCISYLSLFNLYAEHIIRETGLDVDEGGVKTG